MIKKTALLMSILVPLLLTGCHPKQLKQLDGKIITLEGQLTQVGNPPFEHPALLYHNHTIALHTTNDQIRPLFRSYFHHRVRVSGKLSVKTLKLARRETTVTSYSLDVDALQNLD